ncbi:MAG: transporter ATP-binding protein [Chlamydiales bacterium]|jgi:oligopeptide transport system ATP-binding protein|nr:transporter ATP-binding protein [Chlamydiales bacterium]
MRLLEVNDLKVQFKSQAGIVQAVRGANFHVDRGEIVAIVGESGCGKSVTAHAIMQLIAPTIGKITDGEILFEGDNLLKYSPQMMNYVRGTEIGMIFQDPMTSLNPTMTIGQQITESILKAKPLLGNTQAREQAIEMLELVGIPLPSKRVDQYPHEFSGGMRQRVMIAIALACRPKLLIADEPTTALDVTIQAQIIELMHKIQQKFFTSIILITHDLGLVASICSRIIVMYAGQVIEEGTNEQIFYSPKHPYTQGLIGSMPRLDSSREKRLESVEGSPPDLVAPPLGCAFHARCPYSMQICAEPQSIYTYEHKGQKARCWLHHKQAASQLSKFKQAQQNNYSQNLPDVEEV